MKADGKAPAGAENQRRRWMPTALARLAYAVHEPLQFKLTGNRRHGLDGETDPLGNLAAGDRRRQPDRLQDDAPIVRPAELLIGTAKIQAPSPYPWSGERR